MEKPFHIFPSIGYKNSQFQVRANIDDVTIEILHNDSIIHHLVGNINSSQLLLNLNEAGIYIARCIYQNQEYTQTIEVKDSIRMGSSEFKNSFLFDDSNFSFISMKDRLLIYDEKLNETYTENSFNPSSIQHISEDLFLFKTSFGVGEFTMSNFAIYDTNLFKIKQELLDDFLEIYLNIEKNLLWVFDKNQKAIICYEITNKKGIYFSELRKFGPISSYYFDKDFLRLIAVADHKILLIDLTKLTSIYRDVSENNAIDKSGNFLSLEGTKLTFENFFTRILYIKDIGEKLNIVNKEDFVYLGKELINEKPILEDIAEVKSKISDFQHSDKQLNSGINKFDVKDIITNLYLEHSLYFISSGLVIKKRKEITSIIGITEELNVKTNSPLILTTLIKYSNFYFKKGGLNKMLDQNIIWNTHTFNSSILILKNALKFRVFYGENELEFSNVVDLKYIKNENHEYILIQKEDTLFYLYSVENLNLPLLNGILIHNLEYVEYQGTIWYSDGQNKLDINTLKFYNLDIRRIIVINDNKTLHATYKNASQYTFNKNYIKSSGGIIINSSNGKIGISFTDSILNLSENHSKIVTMRNYELFLHKLEGYKNYKKCQINIGNEYISESYMSPDGQFVVLKNRSNVYSWYNLEKDEITNFDSGNFVSFTKDGNMLVEDKNRQVKIFDPSTFTEITPPNYQYYKFLSPDGKLYAELGSKFRYFNKITKEILTAEDMSKIRNELYSHLLSILISAQDAHRKHLEEERINRNKLHYFNKYKSYFESINVNDYKNVSPEQIIGIQNFVEIGIVGTDVKTDVLFPLDYAYYNFSAFSHDSRYFAWVGKTSFSGIVRLHKIEFDEVKQLLSLDKQYIHLLTSKATWLCGFSSSGDFAAYDSIPITYMQKVNDDLFDKALSEPKDSNTNLFLRIHRKNFLCFSPSGDYLALSEQGYDPISMGGRGHQESNAIHISKTKTGENIISFEEHGDMIKYDKSKKVVFVAFSEDEKKLMSLSTDGVVIVRDVDLN